MELKNASAIVTGSSSGIGAAVARQLAENGCRVTINYSRNQKGAEETAEECRALGAEALVVQADVSEDADCRKLADAAINHFGGLQILVNNAGTTEFCRHQELDGLDKQDFMDIYAVNLVGPFQMTRAAESALRENEISHVVNMGSIAAFISGADLTTGETLIIDGAYICTPPPCGGKRSDLPDCFYPALFFINPRLSRASFTSGISRRSRHFAVCRPVSGSQPRSL